MMKYSCSDYVSLRGGAKARRSNLRSNLRLLQSLCSFAMTNHRMIFRNAFLSNLHGLLWVRMMIKSKKNLIALSIIFLVVSQALSGAEAFGEDALLRQAAALSKEGKHDDAVKIYEQLLQADPDSDIVNYNMGIEHYVKEEYDKAVEYFRKALNTENDKIEQNSFLSMGNAFYRQSEAKEKEKKIGEAIELCQKAFQYYKNAVESDRGVRQVKYNCEMAGKRLAALKERIEPPPKRGFISVR